MLQIGIFESSHNDLEVDSQIFKVKRLTFVVNLKPKNND